MSKLWYGVIVYDTLRPRKGLYLWTRTRFKHVRLRTAVDRTGKGTSIGEVSECPDDARRSQTLRTCFS
jgi:hypothetical protein